MKCLDIEQILLISKIRNLWRTVTRIYMLIPGLKGLTPQTSFEFNQCLPVHEASHQPHDWTT